MNSFNAITIGNWEIPGWTLETALFWLVAALVGITVLVIIVFAVLLYRVGKNKVVIEHEEAPETVDYGISVVAPEGLPVLQVALVSGDSQIGLAVNVVEGAATIAAVPGDYSVKVFGLPKGYAADAAIVSKTKMEAVITISEVPEEQPKETPVYIYKDVNIETKPETVDYIVNVVAPEELAGLQVALFSGNVQAGNAVNVIEGSAVVSATPGDYRVALFGAPEEEYEYECELLSADLREVTLTVTRREQEVISEPESEEPILYTVEVTAPEGLPELQVALFNGDTQMGSAVNVVDNKAEIYAEAGDYTVRVFGLPEGYEFSAGILSESEPTATLTVREPEKEEPVEEYIPEPVEIVEVKPDPIEYGVIFEGADGLNSLQVALFNGENQVGAAVNVENGAATMFAEPGDYAVKVFGLPEGYGYTAETFSEERTFISITITEPVKEEIVPAAPRESEPLVIEEESFEGGVLRYDRSFKARLIQSDNDCKSWYSEIKNKLLSYKKVKDRLSWKRESYNLGRIPVARLAYRGNTLCLYLPLNPAEYADTKFKVESVEDNASYVDTPCLYRIKNDKRARYAKELIATVMENIGAVTIEREAVDYYEPYEGVLQLIGKGLIKRNIKSKDSESFFAEKKVAFENPAQSKPGYAESESAVSDGTSLTNGRGKN